MSRHTAPVGLVTTAIVAGRGRQRTLSCRIEQALGRQPGLERLEAQCQVAQARRLERIDVELERAARLVEVDPAVGDDAEPGLGLERRALAIVAEPDALELVALVLEREVGMARRGDRDPADLALDPQVRQARVLADGAADGAGDLADPEDPYAELAGGRGRSRTRCGGRSDASARIAGARHR